MQPFQTIRDIHHAGGPDATDYPALGRAIHELAARLRDGHLDRERLDAFWSSLGSVYIDESIQGRAFSRPCPMRSPS